MMALEHSPALENSEGTRGTEVTPNSDTGLRRSLENQSRGTEGTNPTAPLALPEPVEPQAMAPKTPITATPERPSFATYDDWVSVAGEMLKPGLWYHGQRTGKGDKPPEPFNQWICSPIHAEAITASEAGADFGLLLRFVNPFGQWREWAMPMHLLKGAGDEMRGELLNLGVRIDPSGRGLLSNWLMSRHPKRRMIAATRTGWHGEALFIMPGRNIGTGEVIFQSEHAAHDAFTQTGTLDGWRNTVGRLCLGNRVPVLTVSASLAGPLLMRTHRQGGGIHLIGDSSSGKSTALHCAASVWGDPSQFIRTWNATGNGLEGTAAALNDTAMILDEIGEADPRTVGAIVYAIGNGSGKQRAARTGGAKAVQRWRVMLLSSGERSLSTHMNEGGKQTKAGQEVRLLDVPVARQHGAFDELHELATGRDLSDTLKTACATHHGHIGPAFIERLIADERDFAGILAEALTAPVFDATHGLEGRAAATFALVGMAGELAIEWGLVPWEDGEAMQAATWGYQAWRGSRGTEQTETGQIMRAVSDFIARHGDARFSEHLDGETPVRERAGWWKDAPSNEGRVYLFTSGGLREAVQGFDFTRALDALDDAGWIAERDTGKRTKKTRVGGRPQNLYAITPHDAEAEA